MAKRPLTNPATLEKLAEIQETVQEVCRPNYHEFYKVTTEYGFTKITLPKTRNPRR